MIQAVVRTPYAMIISEDRALETEKYETGHQLDYAAARDRLPTMDDSCFVDSQYRTSNKLEDRNQIYRYGNAEVKWHKWLYTRIGLASGARVLEIGNRRTHSQRQPGRCANHISNGDVYFPRAEGATNDRTRRRLIL